MTGLQKMITICFIAFMLFLCVGCFVNASGPAISNEETFVVVSEQNLYHYPYSIVYHKQTKVMYVICCGHVEQLNNANGLPLLYKREEK